MSEMQKELQPKKKDDKIKCIAGKEWTVFQRRINGDVDFYRGWDDYKNGFGDCEGDFWLGLEELHERTKEGNMELEINMITKDTGIHWLAKYSNFRIEPGSDKYRLHVSGYSGNATGYGLHYSNNNRQFSTKDADNDDWSRDCASLFGGGWWYGAGCYHRNYLLSLSCVDPRGPWTYGYCGNTNLNGNLNKIGNEGIWWRSYSDLMRFSEMKFRKRL